MIVVALALALTAPQTAAQDRFREDQRAAAARLNQHTATEPANWSCADPIIQRNYQSRNERGVIYPAAELGARIADECGLPQWGDPVSMLVHGRA